jgi:hypothetical protein
VINQQNTKKKNQRGNKNPENKNQREKKRKKKEIKRDRRSARGVLFIHTSPQRHPIS